MTLPDFFAEDFEGLYRTQPIYAEKLLIKSIRDAVRLKVLQEKSTALRQLKVCWDIIEPNIKIARPNCSGRNHLTLLFNESPTSTAHMKLIFQYALTLQHLDEFERICLVGTQEYIPIEPTAAYNKGLYDSYRLGLYEMAKIGELKVSDKIDFTNFQANAIPECILQGPVIRFRGFAEWNDPVRYMKFISNGTRVISATYSTRVKPDDKEHLLLVRNSSEISNVITKYFDPPLILSNPTVRTERPTNLTIFTILSGSRILSVLRSFTDKNWQIIDAFFASNPGARWKLIGTNDVEGSIALIPLELRGYIIVYPFIDLNDLNFANSILLFPKGALGGGRTAMEALAKGSTIYGISNQSEIEESVGSEYFFSNYSLLFEAIYQHSSNLDFATQTWVAQWNNINKRMSLKMKAKELLEHLCAIP